VACWSTCRMFAFDALEMVDRWSAGNEVKDEILVS
jgi:hypothetical protein